LRSRIIELACLLLISFHKRKDASVESLYISKRTKEVEEEEEEERGKRLKRVLPVLFENHHARIGLKINLKINTL
jgi:hypothetical protein